MNLYSATYVTAREVRNSILDNKEGFEDSNDITTNTDYDSELDFDSSDNNEFNPILSADYVTADNYIDIE